MLRSLIKFIFSTIFWICAVIGLLVLLLVLGLTCAQKSILQSSHQFLKGDSVLTVVLKGPYVEHTYTKGISGLLLGKEASLYDLTRSIYHASQDDKIKGLVIRMESPSLGTAQLQELRDAVLAFKSSGKPSWCYADSFGESSSGTGLYYLATACEDIWLQPLGMVNLVGITIEVPFVKEAMKKLDIHPEIAQRKEYKSFIETFTRDSFSEANREAQQAIVDSLLDQFVEGIAKERNISHDHIRQVIHQGPYLTKEAVSEKLVDHINYRQNLEAAIKEKLGQQIKFVGVNSYVETLPQEPAGQKVALIFGSGLIQQKETKSALGDLLISSNETYKTFQKAIQDPEVKAIVYRINSPGGSPVASETINSIIRFARDKSGKPVIISMGDTAASGGYWISAAGTKIVAQPATLTGSIGVFGGKYVISGLLDKLGIKFGNISTNENSNMWSFVQTFTPQQWIKLDAMMDDIYDAFSERVVEGRHMTPEQVEKAARGRVWTGEQALALGLVDQLGGVHQALELAKKEAGLDSTAGVTIFPKEKSLAEELAELFDKEEDSLQKVGVMSAVLAPLQKVYAIFTFVFASQDFVCAPLGEVRH